MKLQKNWYKTFPKPKHVMFSCVYMITIYDIMYSVASSKNYIIFASRRYRRYFESFHGTCEFASVIPNSEKLWRALSLANQSPERITKLSRYAVWHKKIYIECLCSYGANSLCENLVLYHKSKLIH